MATSGSTSVAVTSYDTLRFSWSQISQSVANNNTVVSWTLQLISAAHGTISSTATKAWSVTINGVTYSGTNTVGIGANATKTLASGQVTIAHNADGAKSFAYSFSQEFGITFAGASVGTKSGSGTAVLNTIPRATMPGFSKTTADMGETIAIYTAGASDAFRHDLAYSFAGGSYVSIASGVGDLVYWKIPLELANSIPNATSGTVTIRCITKNGSTTIGTKTFLLTAKVPTSVTPTVDTVAHAEAAGVAATIGAYVQSKTQLSVSITASGAYGSTIKSYTSRLLGKTYTGASWESDALTQSGTLSIVTTVTDSRGRTGSKTTDITVLEYTPPQIQAFTVARYDSAGTADPDGVYVGVRLSYSVASLNSKNTATAKVEYKRSIDSTWTTLFTRADRRLDDTLKPQTTVFSTDYEYDFRVTLTDAFSSATPATYTAVLPSGAVILDIKADGKGLAFFKTSTKDGVEIAGQLPNSAIALASGANLNDLTTPGFYVIPTTAIASSILSRPYTDNATASIRVEQTGTGMLRQILQKSTKTDGVIYERGYDSSGWGGWSMVYSGAGKFLWSGSALMTADETIALSEAVSLQQSGIVLVFTRYVSGSAADYYFSCHFFPKHILGVTSTAGTTFTMTTSKMEAISAKYLKIADTAITGAAENNASGTANGVTYSNGLFALRYVIGV